MGFIARGTVVRTVAIGAICGLSVLGLAGCKDTSHDKPGHSVSASPSGSPSSSPSPDAAPSPSASAAPQKGTAIGVDCNGLISPQAIYDYNPNYSLQAGYTPKSGTDASKAVAMQGLACSWINQTSSVLINVAVAHPAASDLAALKASAASGTAVSGLGDGAWFSASGQTGTMQVFSGPFWITASSVAFGAPDDVRALASAAVTSAK